MRIVIFGTGLYYENRKQLLKTIIPQNEIVAFLDNDETKNEHEGIVVCSPKYVGDIEFETVLLMSQRSEEMKYQLLNMGVPERKIKSWNDLLKEWFNRRKLECINEKDSKQNILILTTALGYNGGSIAAVYATIALGKRGKNVLLVSESGDFSFINEMVKAGIKLVLYPSMEKLISDDSFIRSFEFVLVNVFQMAYYAVNLSRKKPVLWWIHEQKSLMETTINEKPQICMAKNFDRINICAVSRMPKENFNYFFDNRIKKILPYGIPDEKKPKIDHKKFVFAIIGSVLEIKAQDLFLKAGNELCTEYDDVEFWVIGDIGDDEYSYQIKKMAEGNNKIKLMGVLNRQELLEVYRKVDVVVCPSRADSLPIVLAEAMMYEIPIILSENVGMVDYLEDKKNCLICKSEDSVDLKNKMSWMLDNKKELLIMGKESRKVYEQWFSIDKFADRLGLEIITTIQNYSRVDNE